MTLLEVLLAVTIIASLMGLVASLLGQARAWTDVGETDRTLMRLQRVGEALRAQWADRRSSVSLDESGSTVAMGPDELTFVTATPILFPEWPLVAVTYRVEADTGTVDRRGLNRRLVYEETRISGMQELPDRHALDAQGHRLRDSMILLDACTELRWERFGRDDRAEEPTSRDDARSDPDARTEPRDPQAEPGVRTGAERTRDVDPEEIEERERLRWRAFEHEHQGLIPAVRLVGEHQGERFGWVFVVRALR